MNRAHSSFGVWLVAGTSLLAAGARAADNSSSALEALLHSQRPEIVRWETQALETRARMPVSDAGVVRIGHVGPRTAVRFADGRLRWFSVEGYAPVLSSRYAVEAGASVTSTDVIEAERNVIALGCQPLTHIESDTRLRATRRLAAGEALCTDNVQAAPEIERDRPVVLSTQRGPVTVSRVLTATTDASAGERVRLRDPASGATFVAIVTGPGFARDPNSQEQK